MVHTRDKNVERIGIPMMSKAMRLDEIKQGVGK